MENFVSKKYSADNHLKFHFHSNTKWEKHNGMGVERQEVGVVARICFTVL